MTSFTPVASLLGGALIGLSASLLLTLNGKVAGISSIVGGALRSKAEERGWRVAFLLGLLAAGFVFSRVTPGAIGSPAISLGGLLLAGLLVGAGTELGNGCTSGHGVCGISRFSKRSIVATLAFLGAGMATVYVVRHVLGLSS
jgi:uncharacterized protein